MTVVLITSKGVVRKPARAPEMPPKSVDLSVVICDFFDATEFENVLVAGRDGLGKWCWYCLKDSYVQKRITMKGASMLYYVIRIS
jgi:hypothetical protein